MRKVLLVIICLLCVGCGNKEISSSVRFKNDYEKYNDKNISLDIDEDNIVVYSSSEEVNDIINEGSGVIFIGNPSDDVSRKVIEIFLKASDSTDLDKLYYIDSMDGIDIKDVDGIEIPTLLFVLDGKIVKYHIGTISDKVDLSKDEEMELYNEYLDGIHEVLQDTCDERC